MEASYEYVSMYNSTPEDKAFTYYCTVVSRLAIVVANNRHIRILSCLTLRLY